MFCVFCRRLCIGLVFFVLLFFLSSDNINNSTISTTDVTQWHPKIYLHKIRLIRRRSWRFFVFNPQCQIPYVNPFAKEFLKWKSLKIETCHDRPDLFRVTYDRTRRRYRLNLNKTVAEKYFASFLPFRCTYIEIHSKSENSSVQSKPIHFNPDWIVPSHFLGIIVECHALWNTSLVLQRDAFSFVQNPRNRYEGTNATRNASKPSVFIFGIDSMSRMNFRRTMPLTSKFVHQEGWYEMEGYNSVTDKTPWKEQLFCDPRKPPCPNDLTLLWEHFRSAGYLTAYAEDVTSGHLGMGSVDFNLHPFLVVIEKVFKTVSKFGYCLGRRRSFSYVFDFAKQLIQRYVLKLPMPLFGVFWTSSFTQNDFRGGRNLDKLFVRYLEEFQKFGLFKSSIVVLVSDRGSRHGPLVDHPSGFLEERLPMLHIYLPRWYRRIHPTKVKALQLNRNRLSSSCDLSLGVRQLIEEAHPGIGLNESTFKCQSILKELPRVRSCDDASIPANSCACKLFLRVPIGDSIAKIAHVVVHRMNKYLKRLNVEKKCHLMELNQVLKAERQLHFGRQGEIVPSPSGLETFHLMFTTKPYGTRFCSMVQSNKDNTFVTTQLKMITRLGPLSNDSYCVKDEMAKKFCICRKS